jgi:DNA repair protein RadC
MKRKSTFEIKVARVSRINESPSMKLDRAGAAYEYWKEKIVPSDWYEPEKEMLVCIILDTRHNTIGHNLVSLGSLNECTAHPREIFRPAIVAAAYAFILMHNHPSGDPAPSEADRRLTRRLGEAGTLLQMPIVDHVIVGKEGIGEASPYFSFREAGLI